MVVGIAPEKENTLTGLKKRVVKGAYLADGDQSVMISEGLAEKLKLGVNDTIVLISQGYHGVNAAGKYPVKGIVSFGSPELNSRLIYMPLATAQWFYGADGLITSAVLDIDSKEAATKAVKELGESLDLNDFEVKDWKSMMPELMELRDLKRSSGKIMDMILYLIVSFGIFGTILMMTKERQYEFGILVSIGMKRRTLAMTTWLETIFLGFLGAMIGIVISYALMYYIMLNPIVVTGEMAETYEKFGLDPVLGTSVAWDIFAKQAVLVFFITSFLALYPLFKIWRMKPVEAMRA